MQDCQIPLKILLCHNYYRRRGGEDLSFEDEARLLEQRGHHVRRYTLHNDHIDSLGRLGLARRSLWNRETYVELRKLLQAERPDVLHCTNTFPLISPSAYDAARSERVPVVQSLRNYRLLCPDAFLMRNGQVCEECLGRATSWPSVIHGCYKGSRPATAVAATVKMLHQFRRRLGRGADCYYTLTEFARQKFIEGGFPAESIFVKNNFVDPDPGVGSGRGGYAVFVGRLSPEKGISTLLEAWSKLAKYHDGLPLKIIGDGPLAGLRSEAVGMSPRIEWLGALPPRQTLAMIGQATLLVMPSVWYETFGRTVIEAFATGTPVVTSRLGAMAELVQDGVTGLHFTPGDPGDLAAKVRALVSDRRRLETMRREARRVYKDKYTAEVNYRQLLAIYDSVLEGSRGALPSAPTEASEDEDRQRTIDD